MTRPLPHGPGHRIAPRRALMTALACWLGFLAILVLVETGRTAAFDSLGLLYWRTGPELRLAGPAALVEAVRALTALGDNLLRSLVVAAAVCALWALRRQREALLLAVVIQSGWLVNTQIKAMVGRARPQIVPHLTEAGGMSFPSGHAFNAALAYIAIALAFAAMSPRRSLRWTLIAGAVALSLMIALSRVWLGVHWPSDVAAGWFGGAGWALAGSALLHRPAAMAAENGSHEDTKMPR